MVEFLKVLKADFGELFLAGGVPCLVAGYLPLVVHLEAVAHVSFRGHLHVTERDGLDVLGIL